MKGKFWYLTGILMIAATLVIYNAPAQATSFSWSATAGDSTWADTTSPFNWTGGSAANGRYPGQVHTGYTDQATITNTTNNPVTLGAAVTLGGATPSLTLSGAGNSLNINSGGTLGMRADISNAGTITINTGGALQNGGTSSGTQYIIGGTGSTVLAGGSLSSTGGTWVNEQALSGYGTISAPVINFTGGTVTANNATALSITGAFTNGSTSVHTPVVNVGTSVALPTGTMTIGTGGTFSNLGVLNVYGTLSNNTATAVTLAGTGGTATLAGGTLDGTGAGFTNTGTLSAYGNILTNLNNSTATTSTINAAGDIKVADITLTNAGNTSHGINLGSHTLDHTTAGTFALAGSGFTTLAGGAITNSGGGSMTNSNQIRGYGTISAPMASNSGGFTANTAGQTLTVSGDIASNTGTLSANGGTLLLTSKITGEYSVVANSPSEVDLNGADLVGPTSFFHFITLGSSSSGSGAINLTGDSTWENRFQVNSFAPLNVNGHTLTLKNFTGSLPSGTFLNVGTGNLKIDGPAAINSGGNIHLGGGNINYTTSSTVDTLQASVIGSGDIKTKLLSNSGALATASGGTLYVSGGAELSLPGGTYNNGSLSSSTGATLDIRSTINNSQPFTSYITPNGGIVNLDGATLTTGTGATISLYPGTINITNNSTFKGTITSSATLGINAGKELDISSGANVTLTAGSLTNNGTLVIDHATLTNNIGGTGTTVTNNGTVNVHSSTVNWGDFANNGTYTSDPSTMTFTNLTVGTTGVVTATAGDKYQIKGNFINNSTQNTSWNTSLAELDFIGTTGTSHNVAIAGEDKGADYSNNFAWHVLDLTGQKLVLSDGNTGNMGTAMDVEVITGETIVGHMVTNITGHVNSDGSDPTIIYYNPYLNPELHAHRYFFAGGGYLTPTPLPGAILLFGSGLLSLLGLRRRIS